MSESAANASNLAKAKRSSTPSTKIPTPTQAKILAGKLENPHLSTRKLGKLLDVDYTTVSKTLTRYGIDYGAVESFQKHRASIFAGLQSRIITSITDSDINKATLLQRLSSLGILYDKETIERTGSDGTAKPLVVIQVNTVHNPVDNTTLLTTPLLHNVTPTTQAIDITTNMDTMSDNV